MISVIIPVYNEEKVLRNTLLQLQNHYVKHDTIVVDGGSEDRSCEITRQFPDVILLHAKKGRASQLNTGAKSATGDWLLFLHADTMLPLNALLDIEKLQINSNVLAGGFRHRFSGNDWRLRLISELDNYRCQRTRIMYGDQAMFVCRDLFEMMGGFPELPVLEDLYFSVKLKKHTLPFLMDSYVTTDSRKFTKIGIWRGFFRLAVILTRVRLGLPVTANYPFFKDVR